MKTLLIILALLCAGCGSQQQKRIEKRRQDNLLMLKKIFGDEQYIPAARAIEGEIQRIKIEKALLEKRAPSVIGNSNSSDI